MLHMHKEACGNLGHLLGSHNTAHIQCSAAVESAIHWTCSRKHLAWCVASATHKPSRVQGKKSLLKGEQQRKNETWEWQVGKASEKQGFTLYIY